MNSDSELTQTAEALERGWALRADQRIEACWEAAAALKRSLGIPAGPVDHGVVKKLFHSDDCEKGASAESADRADDRTIQIADVLLLLASLARSQWDLPRAREIALAVESELRSRDLAERCFHLHAEKGLNSLHDGDDQKALEEFLAAVAASRRPSDRANALSNVLLCKENLGLPTHQTEADLAALDLGAGARASIEAYRRRAAFRTGHIAEVCAPTGAENYTQSDYLRLWVSTLPYVSEKSRLAASDRAHEIDRLVGATNFYLRKFRLRTIEGTLHADDLAGVKASEVVSRVYLWVWRWLEDAEKFSIDRVLETVRVAGLESGRLDRGIPVEDAARLRNALLWLGFFDAAAEKRLTTLIRRLQPRSVDEASVYALEKMVIDYFHAKRDGRQSLSVDLRAEMERHPLWNSEELRFKELVEKFESGNGSGFSLARRLREVIDAATERSSARFEVDLSRHQLLDHHTDSRVISEPMARAVEILQKEHSVTCERFAAACFGITRYDSLIHAAKIFNLLTRMKEFFGDEISFRTKAGFVIAEGSWSDVGTRRENAAVSELRDHPIWKALVFEQNRGTPPAQPTSSQAALSKAGPFHERTVVTRGDLESWSGRSRATTNRLLARWLKTGLITREGAARATKYRLSSKFLELSESGGLL